MRVQAPHIRLASEVLPVVQVRHRRVQPGDIAGAGALLQAGAGCAERQDSDTVGGGVKMVKRGDKVKLLAGGIYKGRTGTFNRALTRENR
ncbi:MAG: hypothetical protein PHT62_14210 [Desulfotomaculaceae bacterium]|nr:hypothetical protein [Desulfotomaculaceae bacterium]